MAPIMFLAMDRAISGRLLSACHDHIRTLNGQSHPQGCVLAAIERFCGGQEPHDSLQTEAFEAVRGVFMDGLYGALTADEWGLLAVWQAYRGWDQRLLVDGPTAQVCVFWLNAATEAEWPHPSASSIAWVSAAHAAAQQASEWVVAGSTADSSWRLF